MREARWAELNNLPDTDTETDAEAAEEKTEIAESSQEPSLDEALKEELYKLNLPLIEHEPPVSVLTSETAPDHYVIDSAEILPGKRLRVTNNSIVSLGTWKNHSVTIKTLLDKEERPAALQFACETTVIEKLMECKVPCMMPYLGKIKNNDYSLITKYVPHTLWTELQHNTLDWGHRLITIEGILKFVTHSHAKGVLHRDLKASNVLLSEHFQDAYVCDFGSAVQPPDIHAYRNKTDVAHGHTAPEIYAYWLYSDKSDIYSFGSLLWSIAACQWPLAELNIFGTIEATMKNRLDPPPAGCPKVVETMIRLSRLYHREDRPTAENLLELLSKDSDAAREIKVARAKIR